MFYRIFLCKQEVKSSRWWIVSCNKCRLWSFSTFLSPISSLRKPFLCLTFRTISICLKVTNRLISQAATKIRTWVTRKKIVTSKIFQEAPLPLSSSWLTSWIFFCLNLDHASRINYLELGCCCKLAHCNNIIEEQQKLEGSACFFFKCSHGKSAPKQSIHPVKIAFLFMLLLLLGQGSLRKEAQHAHHGPMVEIFILNWSWYNDVILQHGSWNKNAQL